MDRWVDEYSVLLSSRVVVLRKNWRFEIMLCCPAMRHAMPCHAAVHLHCLSEAEFWASVDLRMRMICYILDSYTFLYLIRLCRYVQYGTVQYEYVQSEFLCMLGWLKIGWAEDARIGSWDFVLCLSITWVSSIHMYSLHDESTKAMCIDMWWYLYAILIDLYNIGVQTYALLHYSW